MTGQGLLRWHRWLLTKGTRLSDQKGANKCLALCLAENSNTGSNGDKQRNGPSQLRLEDVNTEEQYYLKQVRRDLEVAFVDAELGNTGSVATRDGTETMQISC
jgi:hypothetical protein